MGMVEAHGPGAHAKLAVVALRGERGLAGAAATQRSAASTTSPRSTNLKPVAVRVPSGAFSTAAPSHSCAPSRSPEAGADAEAAFVLVVLTHLAGVDRAKVSSPWLEASR
ncbi:hypothetical protein SAFG77S_04620 [Streptomyces afghaniensis]